MTEPTDISGAPSRETRLQEAVQPRVEPYVWLVWGTPKEQGLRHEKLLLAVHSTREGALAFENKVFEDGARGKPPAELVVQAEPIAVDSHEAAALLRVSESHFQRHIRPALRPVFTGQLTRYRVDDLRRWAERQAGATRNGAR